jgi:hypothetical protein
MAMLVGMSLMVALFPLRGRTRDWLGSFLFLAPAIGSALLSVFCLAVIFSCGELPKSYPYFELAFAGLLILIAGIVFASQREDSARASASAKPLPTPGDPDPPWLTVLKLILGLVLLIQAAATILSVYLAYNAAPDGMWDAWGIWNVRARNLFDMGPSWRDAFNEQAPHADYPVLLPLTVVRAWSWEGESTTAAPFAVAMLFYVVLVGLLFCSLLTERSMLQAMLATVVFLATPFVQLWGPSQYADVPLSVFMLASLVILGRLVGGDESPGAWPVLLGLVGASAAWTKNEGIAWALLLMPALACLSLMNRERFPWLRTFGCFLCGALPVGLCLIAFKSCVPSNDLVAGQSGQSTLDRLTDMSRWEQIGELAYATAPRWLPWLVVWAAVMRLHRTGRWILSLLVLGGPLVGMIAIYLFVYLTTPHDLGWHLRTSLDRLFLQLWPAFLYAYFRSLRTPEEMVSAATVPGA